MKLTKNQDVEYQLQNGSWRPAKAVKACTVDEKSETARLLIAIPTGGVISALAKCVRGVEHSAPSKDSAATGKA